MHFAAGVVDEEVRGDDRLLRVESLCLFLRCLFFGLFFALQFSLGRREVNDSVLWMVGLR